MPWQAGAVAFERQRGRFLKLVGTACAGQNVTLNITSDNNGGHALPYNLTFNSSSAHLVGCDPANDDPMYPCGNGTSQVRTSTAVVTDSMAEVVEVTADGEPPGFYEATTIEFVNQVRAPPPCQRHALVSCRAGTIRRHELWMTGPLAPRCLCEAIARRFSRLHEVLSPHACRQSSS